MAAPATSLVRRRSILAPVAHVPRGVAGRVPDAETVPGARVRAATTVAKVNDLAAITLEDTGHAVLIDLVEGAELPAEFARPPVAAEITTTVSKDAVTARPVPVQVEGVPTLAVGPETVAPAKVHPSRVGVVASPIMAGGVARERPCPAKGAWP